MPQPLEQLRAHRFSSRQLKRGTASPPVSKTAQVLDAFFSAGVFAFFGAILGGISWGIYTQSLHGVSTGAIRGVLIACLAYSFLPLLVWVWSAIRHGRWPSREFFDRFTLGEKWVCLVMVAWCLVYGGNQVYSYRVTGSQSPDRPAIINRQTENGHRLHKRHDRRSTHIEVAPSREAANLPLQNAWWWAFAWLSTTFLLGGAQLLIKNGRQRPNQRLAADNTTTLPFRLWLGHSTGHLAQLSHGAGLAAQQKIALCLADASQNILVLGGIGSGKTTRAMHPFLLQVLDQDCGGLIFDIKGDFQQAVRVFAQETNRKLICIGPGFEKMNLLAGLTPEIAASFLKSAFLLSGKGHGDAFWMDTATELCRNTLGLLSFLPASYSLQGLYAYLFSVENRLAADRALEAVLPSLDEKATRLLTSYWQYHEQIFDRFDEKVKAGVNATIAQVLSPFNHPDLVEAFCSVGEEHVPMEAVLEGAVYLVSLPLSVWGLGGKVVYSLIKLRFYNVMQQRAARVAWNQARPVFFMCDEFQEIVSANKDGLSDLNFWDKSRSSKTIGIISAQAVSSFYAAIGDRDVTHALLQNFRQKLCFRTEDATTLNYFNQLADKVEVIRKTYGQTKGSQTHPGGGLFSSGSSSTSNTENTTFVEKAVLSPQLFRNLDPDQAVALLSVNGHSMDDVIGMMPVYIN